jgi:integrase
MAVVALHKVGAHPDSWAAAVDRFLDRKDLAVGTRRVYAGTLARLGDALGNPDVATVSGDELTDAFSALWPNASAPTWNRSVATVRSFFTFAARHGWVTKDPTLILERRREVVDHNRALSRAQIDAITTSRQLSVRDRCLFRMLYETAARAEEVLRLNIEDLDIPGKRATTVRKGGDSDVIFWQTGTARLLPWVIDDRRVGPLFLSERPPTQTRVPAGGDFDPATGHARLSYRRAAEVFTGASGGATLHQLRHSAITHLAEAGVPLPLLMAKSRHASLKTLSRYARPGLEAVAALTAEHDPARRR